MSFLTPALLVTMAALAIPVLIHLVQRERRQVVPFPSLMFLRRIPYQSVRRRRVRNWLLLLTRLAALLLLILAFARPFFPRGALAAATAARGGREVVILLDRSASMSYGDHWTRARDAARRVVDRLGGSDRATLVFFTSTAEEAVRSTGDRVRLAQAIDSARPGSGGTQYGPALKLAASILAKSPQPRREAVLISDFQKSGWRGGDDVRFPQAVALTAVPVETADARNLSVPSVTLARAPFSGKERITVTAAIRNFGVAVTNVPVALQVGDNVVETIPVSVGANASTSVAFAPFTLARPGLTAMVKAGSDAMPDDNTFRFVLAPSTTVPVLVIEPENATPTPFLTRALSIGTAPRFEVDAVSASHVTSSTLAAHSMVVLDGVPASRIGSAALASFVQRGGGLLMVVGGESADARAVTGSADTALPSAKAGDDDSAAHVTTIGFVDYSHPVFEIFQGPHGGDFAAARIFRYRPIATRQDDRVLARFSDGAPALIERRLGAGRVIAWSSTFDDSWTDLAVKPVFLPFVQQVARYLVQYQDAPSSRTVGQALDLAQRAQAGEASPHQPQLNDVASSRRIVLTPSGRRIAAAQDGKPLRFVELEEQGFYEIRSAADATEPVRVAVNLDPAESDLSRIDPQELVAAVTGHAQPGAAATGPVPLTTEELEHRQSIWRYLLLAALLLFAGETAFANRLTAGASRVTRQLTGSAAPSRVTPIFEGRADVAR